MNILGIGPHPDDLEFGCGGLFLKLAQAGHKISLLIMTDGSVGGPLSVRAREQEKAAAMLKARLYWGGFRDTEAFLSRELILSIESHMELARPDMVFVNYGEDTHQDHRNVARAVETAARFARNLVFYEVPTTINFQPSIYADIGRVIGAKVALLKCHRSQVHKTRIKNLSIVETARSTAVFRGCQDRVKYAEGFMARRLLLDPLLGCK